MLTLILSVLLQTHDPCEHMPTPLSREQTKVCRKVMRAAEQRQLDPVLAATVAYHETKFRYRIGAAGEVGPLQAMPRYWCPTTGKCDEIQAGLKALGYYLSRHDSVEMALTRYNGAGKSARAYARKVTKMHREVLARSQPVLIFMRAKEVIDMLGNLAEVFVVAAEKGVRVVPVPFASTLKADQFGSGSEVYQLREALREPAKGTGWRRLTEKEEAQPYLVLLDGEYSIRTRGDLQELRPQDNALVARISKLGVISSFLF